MRTTLRSMSWTIVFGLLCPALASAQQIMFTGTSAYCDGLYCFAALKLGSGEGTTFKMAVYLNGNVEDGISAAEFAVTGLPEGWIAVIEPPAGATVTGNPFLGGTVVVFDACQVIDPGPPEDRSAELFDVTLVAKSDVPETWMHVTGHESPTFAVNANVSDCASPSPTVFVAGVDVLVLNPGVSVSVEERPWGQVKALYAE